MTPDLIFSDKTLELVADREPRSTYNFIIFERVNNCNFGEQLTKAFNHTVTQLHESIGKRKSPKHDKFLRYHIEQVLLNLIKAISSVKYLGIFGNNNLYSKTSEINKKQPEERIISPYFLNIVISHLVENESINKRSGYMFKEDDPDFFSFEADKGMNKYYPTPELINKLSPYLFLVSSDFTLTKTKMAFVKHKQLDEAGNVIGTIKKYPRTHQLNQDRNNLEKINKFLSNQNFALKAPLKRIYSENENRGGRLYTAIQNIPNNRLPIRKSLRLNGEPLIEIDFKANHLSMCIALHESESYTRLPDDPYTLLLTHSGFKGKETSLYREYAKAFVTRALGAKDLRGAQNAFRAWQKKHEFEYPHLGFKTMTNGELFKSLRKGFEELFPNTPLFSDRGAHLQKLEGDILMAVILEGIEKEIPIIPLHDACLCANTNRKEVESLMKKHWAKALGIDYQPIVEVKN
jgi:hypothetical protein